MQTKSEKRREFLINLAYYVVIGAIIYFVFKYAISYILPFLLAFALVTLINPLIRTINSKLPNKRSSISVVLMIALYVVVGVLLFVIVFNTLIQIWNITVTIADKYYPESIKPALIATWNAISTYIQELPPDWQKIIYNVQNNLMNQIQGFVVGLAPNLLSFISRFTGGVPGFVIAFVFTIMLSFFISMQYEDVLVFFQAQLSEKTIKILKDTRSIVGSAMFKYLRALLTLMAITAVELMIGLSIIGIENVIILSIGISLLDALPVFGTGTVLIPWVFISLVQGDFKKAGGLAIVYLVITSVRGLIEPKIVGDKLGINPIVSMVAIYIGFKWSGVLGMILMPILVQSLSELNRLGTIKLFKNPKIKEESLPKEDKKSEEILK